MEVILPLGGKLAQSRSTHSLHAVHLFLARKLCTLGVLTRWALPRDLIEVDRLIKVTILTLFFLPCKQYHSRHLGLVIGV